MVEENANKVFFVRMKIKRNWGLIANGGESPTILQGNLNHINSIESLTVSILSPRVGFLPAKTTV